MAEVIKIAVLFSGDGTNLQNLIERFHGRRFADKEVKILPVTNRPDAYGIERARSFGIKSAVIDHKEYDSRESFDAALAEFLEKAGADLVVMAGFMRIVTEVFTSRIEAVNLHPSLLPLFKGANAIEESFKSGMRVGGVTVHRVDSTLDGGEILDQMCVEIGPSDTLESFRKKIREAEHEILPRCIAKLLKLPLPQKRKSRV